MNELRGKMSASQEFREIMSKYKPQHQIMRSQSRSRFMIASMYKLQMISGLCIASVYKVQMISGFMY